MLARALLFAALVLSQSKLKMVVSPNMPTRGRSTALHKHSVAQLQHKSEETHHLLKPFIPEVFIVVKCSNVLLFLQLGGEILFLRICVVKCKRPPLVLQTYFNKLFLFQESHVQHLLLIGNKPPQCA